MQARSFVFAVLGSVFIIGATFPAFADDDDWRGHERRGHEWREHHEYRGGRPGYYPQGYYAPPPPVYYAPPPVYYAPPPPLYYAPPLFSFGINLH